MVKHVQRPLADSCAKGLFGSAGIPSPRKTLIGVRDAPPISPSPHLAFLSHSNPTSLSIFVHSASARMSKPTTDPTMLENFPKPLSPPLPAKSKSVELSRAMTATAASSLFKLSRSDVVFEDEWLIVVNKPQGVYCERVLASVPDVLDESVRSAGVSEIDEIGEGKRLWELHLSNQHECEKYSPFELGKNDRLQ
ncbi:unnamed protein product [Rhodiola kirilowii]